MKVLILHSLYAPHFGGGAEVVVQELVEGIRSRDHEVVVATIGPGEDTVEDVICGVRIIRLKLANVYWHNDRTDVPKWRRIVWHARDSYNIRMARALEGLLRSERPDLVCCHNLGGWSASVWSAIRACNLPIVQVLHDYYSICASSNMFARDQACVDQCYRCRVFRPLNRRSSQEVEVVIGVSRYVLDAHLRMGYFSRARRVKAIHNARSIAGAGARRMPPGGLVTRFGFLGTLAPAKGIEMLIRTFAGLVGTDLELVVAGDGNQKYVAGLAEAVAHDKRIQLKGQMRIDDFFPTIDYLIVPSIWQEPLGMVIPESFAYGVPVLAARVGGIPEMVENGHNGYLFEPNDSTALEKLIETVMADRASYPRLSSGAEASAKRFLDVEGWISEYEILFEEEIAEHRRRLSVE